VFAASRWPRFAPHGLALTLAVLFLTTSPAPAAAADATPAVLFKVATIAPEGSTWMKLMHELDERVRTETAGEVGFRFYPGGQQGSDLDVLRKIRSGQIQGAGLTGVGLGEIEPSLRIMELPFLFRTDDEVTFAHTELDSIFDARLGARGFHLLGWAEVGSVRFFSQKPVGNAGDLKAQKTWLWEGDPLAEAFLQELGVTPVPLNITDVLTALQTGIVDAVYITPYGCLTLQWFPKLKYMVDVPITHAMGAVVLSEEQFGKLTPQQAATVERIAADVFGRLNAATRQQNEEAQAAILGRNIEAVGIDAASLAQFEEIGRRVWERLVGVLYERPLLDRLTSALAQSRREGGAAR
jgi:TRAP-type C4-dicarboxylate transport system substrate-binding protein